MKDRTLVGCMVVFMLFGLLYGALEAVLWLRALWNLGGI